MKITSRPGVLRNLQIGFGLSLLLLVITSVASYSSINNLLDQSQWVDHTDSVLIKIDRIQSLLRNAESGQRGDLLTGDTTFLRALNNAQAQIGAAVDSIQEMTADNPEQMVNIKELRAVVFTPLPLLQKVVQQKATDNVFNADDLQKCRTAVTDVRNVLTRMTLEERRLMVGRVANVQRYSAYTPVLIVVAALLAILITIFFYGRVHKDFNERQALYTELQNKEADVARRIEIISGIAD